MKKRKKPHPVKLSRSARFDGLNKKSKKNNILSFGLIALMIFSLALANLFFVSFGLAQEEIIIDNSPSPSAIPEASIEPSPSVEPTESPEPTESLEPSVSPEATTTPEALVSPSPTPQISTAEVGTGMNLISTGNERPMVAAIWEMNQTDLTENRGGDDSAADGAQFMPSGQYQVDKVIEVCAVVSDPDGLADLVGVGGQVYYPEDIYLGPNHSSSQTGCGQSKGEWFNMSVLTANQGLELFCQQIRNNNANLPSFKTGYDFDALCGPAGDLTKQTAKVFCGQSKLAYNDPAGQYRVKAAALDQKQEAGVLENNFKYLELVAFEIDFDNINYGSMRLNTPKVLSGNDEFLANDHAPTIRNIGNMRLSIEIKQNDMGLGQSETGWNLAYRARVGQDVEFINYWPDEWANLAGSINLGQTSPLDLAIEVLRFPETIAGEHYAGKLSLNATVAPQLTCAK